jgi:hypothetical protein
MLKSVARALLVALTALALVGTGVTSASAAGGGGTIAGYVSWWLGQATLYDATTGEALQTRDTWGGDFTFTDLPPGQYKVGFVGSADDGIKQPARVPEFWNNVATLDEAEVITITGSEQYLDIDADLAPEPASISGTLVDAAGGPEIWNSTSAELRAARVYDLGGNLVPTTTTRIGYNGLYEIWGLPPGQYYVQIGLHLHTSWRFAWTFIGDTPYLSKATPITVVAGATTAGPTVTLPRAATVYSTIHDSDGVFLTDVVAEAWLLNDDTGEYEFITSATSYSGSLTLGNLWPGTYRLRFVPPKGTGYAPEWWQDSPYPSGAQPVVLATGDMPYLTVELGGIAAYRLGGVDRYDANVVAMKRTDMVVLPSVIDRVPWSRPAAAHRSTARSVRATIRRDPG